MLPLAHTGLTGTTHMFAYSVTFMLPLAHIGLTGTTHMFAYSVTFMLPLAHTGLQVSYQSSSKTCSYQCNVKK